MHIALVVVAIEVVLPGLSWLTVVARPAPNNAKPVMDSHENACTTPHGRKLIVNRPAEVQSVGAVAMATGLTAKTVCKWRDRFAAEGRQGPRDRPARPLCSARRLPPQHTAQVEALPRQCRSGPAIAGEQGLAGSTVGLVVRRVGLNRLKLLDPKPEIIRCGREHPGELNRTAIKKLGRIDHRITGDSHGRAAGAAPAGNTCTSPSTTPPGWPSRRRPLFPLGERGWTRARADRCPVPLKAEARFRRSSRAVAVLGRHRRSLASGLSISGS